MTLTIPSKPKGFSPSQPPPGYRKVYVSFAATRKLITPRLQLIHTNGASRQGSIEASLAWAERRVVNGNSTTLPTFQVDRDGDAAQFIDSNRAQNAQYKTNPWGISYETADTGYLDDPTISAFTEAQLQMLANGFAYCSMLYKIPLEYPLTWDGAGSACHTEPFAYPYWTNVNGKICPGSKKKKQVRDIILPHARKIVEAWTSPAPKPPPTGEVVNWNPSKATVDSIKDAPGVTSTVANENNDWAMIAMLKAIQHMAGIPITGRYDQATANVVDSKL